MKRLVSLNPKRYWVVVPNSIFHEDIVVNFPILTNLVTAKWQSCSQVSDKFIHFQVTLLHVYNFAFKYQVWHNYISENIVYTLTKLITLYW